MKQKWTEQKVLAVIAEARLAGKEAALTKLQELRKNGPQYTITNGGDKPIDTMLDLCGFASLKIKAKGNFYLIAKRLSKDNMAHRHFCRRDYYGGGRLSIFDSSMRQEISVNIAACEGQAKVLESYDIECSITSRID